MGPRYSPNPALLYDREKQGGNASPATPAVAHGSCLWISARRISWWWTEACAGA
jgi:hypothetical protein